MTEMHDADLVEAMARGHCDYFGGAGWWDTGLIADTTPKALEAMRLVLAVAEPAIRAAVEREVVEWLRSLADAYDRIDDGQSGLDDLAQVIADLADAIEQGKHRSPGHEC